MSLVVLDALEEDNNLSVALQETLTGTQQVDWFKLKDYQVNPCRSCGSCSYKSCGKCVIQDDFEQIVIKIAKSEGLIFLTPIRFGGYSSQLKKVIDRLMVLGVPLYMVRGGHLLHPMRYDIKWILGLGLSEGISLAQENSFEKLIENNALNLTLKHTSLVCKSADLVSEIKTRLELAYQEVLV